MIGYVRDIFRVLGMPCRSHTELFSRQLDAPLAPGIAMGLRIHVLYCTGCKRFRAQIHALRALMNAIDAETETGAEAGAGSSADQKMPPDVRARVMQSAAAHETGSQLPNT